MINKEGFDHIPKFDMKIELRAFVLISIILFGLLPSTTSINALSDVEDVQGKTAAGTGLEASSTSSGFDGSFPGVVHDFFFASDSENNIYAVGSDGNIWHWNGAWWWRVTSGLEVQGRIHVESPNLIYGLAREADGSLEVFKWDGSSWRTITRNGGIMDDFDLVSENEIYAIGNDGQVHLWNGSFWSQVTSGQLSVKDHIRFLSLNQIYGIGTNGDVLKWDRTQWETLTTGLEIRDYFVLESEDKIYAVDTSQRVALWNGQTWSSLTPETSFKGRVVVNSPTEIFRLDPGKIIWQWNGEKWVQVTTLITDSDDFAFPTYYRAKYLGGMFARRPALLAYQDRLVIAGVGEGGGVYVREWTPLREESWDSATNSISKGNYTWYSLDGATTTTPELSVEDGTLHIYVLGQDGNTYQKHFIAPHQWSQDWEVSNGHVYVSGPISAAGFTVMPCESGGYPSQVSLIKYKPFNLTASTPDWVDELIIYELPTSVFTSPNGPGSGTFKSATEKLDHLEALGVNAIWLTGHSWSDPRHFTNIYTQYAVIHPGFIEPTLGSDPSNIEQTELELKELVEEAHNRGIRVILDAVTHGVMSYSPLVSGNCTPPSYVGSHPRQSSITPHPDWFGATSYPTEDEAWCKTTFPQNTVMIDYVGGYEQADLDDWWVGVWTDYVLDYGIDGIKLDLGSSRWDLWARVKKNAYKAGREIIILPEGGTDDYPFDAGIYDVELISWEWVSFAPMIGNKISPGYGITVSDMSRVEKEIFPLLTRQCYIIPISLHDCHWYNIRGSRFRMGYGTLLTPFIPMFIAGEEFNNPYILLHNCTESWLLASELHWEELENVDNASFFEDMRKAMRLRKTEQSLNYFSPQGNDPNVAVISDFYSSLEDTPAPYLRFSPDGGDAILIAGNSNSTHSAFIRMNIPLNQTELVDTKFYRVKDLWSGTASYIQRQKMAEYEVTITPDNFRILKITPWDPAAFVQHVHHAFFWI